MEKITLKVQCTASYMEDGTEYWTKDHVYNAVTYDFNDYTIETNIGFKAHVGSELSKKFDKYFKIVETHYSLMDDVISAIMKNEEAKEILWQLITKEKMRKLNSSDIKDMFYSLVWKEHVVEDVLSYADDNDIPVTQETAEKVADRYVYERDYDCNLSYWTNINNILSEVNSEVKKEKEQEETLWK